jgi:hypothetical protein
MVTEPPEHTTNGYPDGPPEIHQAAGMLTGQLDVGITEAYARLHAHAHTTGQTSLAVARDIITGQLTLPPSETPPS